MRVAIPVLTVMAALVAAGAWPQTGVAVNEVRLCEHTHHTGLCHSFFLESHMRHRLVRKLPPSIDNKISSIQVGDGVVLFVFQHPHFQGANHRFWSQPTLHEPKEMLSCMSVFADESWDDQISSLILTPAGQSCNWVPDIGPIGEVEGVYLSSYEASTGKCHQAYYPLPEDPSARENRYPDLGPYMNKKVDTAYLCASLEVELYPEPHFKGAPVVIRGGETSSEAWFYLADLGVRDAVSSMIIRSLSGEIEVAGGPPPPIPPARGGEAAGEPHRAPPAGPQQVVVGGPITVPSSNSITLELDTNRPGHDYTNFDLIEPRPEICLDACREDGRCRAFTYVGPGVQGSKARCWLKDLASRPERAEGMVSGMKHNSPQP